MFGPSDETLSNLAVQNYLDLPFMIKNKEFKIKVFVVDNLQTPVLLGINFLAKYNTVINADNIITIDDFFLSSFHVYPSLSPSLSLFMSFSLLFLGPPLFSSLSSYFHA